MTSRFDTTQLLVRTRDGDEAARAALFTRLYEPLRELARRQLRRRGPDTLHSAELLHEAYLKLVEAEHLSVVDRAHFLAISARVMRQVLIDRYRHRVAAKRGGVAAPLPLDEGAVPVHDRGATLLAVDEALERLTGLDPRAGQVVELRFYGGMNEAEIASALGISARTVRREWRTARAWLARELGAA